MSYKTKLKLSALALSVGMACSAQAAYNPQFSEVYSFGDSLSDMGAMQGLNTITSSLGINIGGVFTTPSGKTASGHLAQNYGHESKAALQATVDQSKLGNFMMVGMMLNSAEGLKGITDVVEQAKGSMSEKTAAAVEGSLTSLKTLNNKMAAADSANPDALKAEAQRIAFKLLVEHGSDIQAELNKIGIGNELNIDISDMIDYVTKEGNNFAIGGASATSSDNASTFPVEKDELKLNVPLFQKALNEQVSKYLARDGKADPNALYTITAGANDLFKANTVMELITAGGYPEHMKTANDIGNAEGAKFTQAKIKELQDSGKSISAEVMTKILADAKEIGTAKGKEYLQKTLIEPIIVGSAREVATQTKRLMAAGAKYVVVTNMPDVTETPDYVNQSDEEKAIAREGVNGFNQMLQASLGKSSVIYVDINSFLKTIKANPQKFGFDVAKANQTFCDGSSLLCAPKDAELKKQLAAIDSNKATSAEQKATAKQKLIEEAAKNYIFADGVHPSSAVHKYLADVVSNGYLKAAGYNASMQSLARSGQNELAELFENRRIELVANPLAKGELRPYVNISGSRHDGAEHHNLAKGKVDSVRLYAAMDYGISEQTSGGFMLNVQRDKQDFKQDMAGKQEREAYIAGIYLNQHITDHWSWGFNSYVGKGDYDQVRSYTLGDNSNTNKVVAVRNTSETDSIMVGGSLGANGRYDISGIDLMPRINLNYQYEHIDSYAEKTDTAGAVRFDDTNLKRGELALGLNVSKTFQVSGMAVRPYADLDWRQQLAGDKDQEVNWKTEASTNGYINEVYL